MVFAELREDEKEAFFSLLDEYFSYRPHLLPSAAPSASPPTAAGAGAAGQTSAGAAAAGFIGRQMAAHPQAAANLVSSALRANQAKDEPAASAASNPRLASQLGRAVATGAQSLQSLQSLAKPPPPQPAQKPPGVRGSAPSGLVTRKAIGSYSTESKGAFLASGVQQVWNYKKPKPAEPDLPLVAGHAAGGEGGGHVGGAGFAPPPPRRSMGESPAPAYQEQEQEQERGEEEQFVEAPETQQQQGEWVEALYDYQGDAATDISLHAGDQFVLVERTSADWWTGEHNGKRGLFPASYVKVL